MTDFEAMSVFIVGIDANPIQALHLSDIALSVDQRISWTYLPSGVRRSLYPLIERGLIKRVFSTVEDDPQIYEWLVVTELAIAMMRERFSK